MYFDGSDVELTVSDENVNALDLGPPTASGNPVLYLSTKSKFTAGGISGRREDVVAFSPGQLGDTTAGTYGPGLLFDGSQFGLSSFNIDGVQLSTAGPAPAPLAAAQLPAPLADAAELNAAAPGTTRTAVASSMRTTSAAGTLRSVARARAVDTVLSQNDAVDSLASVRPASRAASRAAWMSLVRRLQR
jgi:hypothetical protein